MSIDSQYEAQDLLLRLMAWKDDMGGLDTLQAETVALCGRAAILDLPKDSAMIREKLIDVVEDYLDSSASSR